MENTGMMIVERKLTRDELKKIAENTFGEMVKAVVDIQRNLLAIDAELHADLESYLLEQGSKQGNLWGINLYPDLTSDAIIEFDSMINMRPSQGNATRGVDNEQTQNDIKAVVFNWVEE